MTLFKPSDISDHADASAGLSVSFSGESIQEMAIGKGMMALSQIMTEPFKEGQVTHFISDGCWSMHHLTQFILNSIGPSHLHLATWSVSEFSARQLVQWLTNGQLLSISGVIDFRSKNRHAEAFHLAKQNFTRLKLANCHAKITVIHNDNFKVVINGSPNWTENPRLESGTISIDNKIADRFINLIEQIIERSEYELE